MGRDFQKNTCYFSRDTDSVQCWAVVALIPSSCSTAFGLFKVTVSLFPYMKEPADLTKLEFLLSKPTRLVSGVPHLYLCQMCIDHNSPAAGWVFGCCQAGSQSAAHKLTGLLIRLFPVKNQDNSVMKMK